jgi:hypothetical protein
MNLARLQATFLAQLHADDVPLPPEWDARMARGLAVHRNNHRHALMEAMRSAFERTRRWVGEDAFAAAATHHLLLHPPSGWTLDAVGEGFAGTVAALFARDPEVGDLAALEWAMHRVFAAPDTAALDAGGFRRATAGFADGDWATMRLRPQPGLQVIDVGTDCVALWQALGAGTCPPDPPPLPLPHVAIVWRAGFDPVCCLAPAEEGRALRLAAAGAAYGELCALQLERHGAEAAALEAGRMLSEWLQAGMLACVSRAVGTDAA